MARRFGKMNRTIFRHLMPQTIQVLKKPDINVIVKDEYGNVTESSWPTTGVKWPARVARRGGSEDLVRKEVNRYALTVLLPPTVDVADGDRVLWEGDSYDIDEQELIDHPQWATGHHIRLSIHRAS